MFQVNTVLIDEIPNNSGYIGLCPAKPILDSRLNIEHSVAVKFRRVHLVHLILVAMLATIDGSNHNGIRVKTPACKLAAVGQLEDALTDLGGRTVDLIEKQNNGLGTSLNEPGERAKLRSLLPIDFYHLR